ncbi:hypothetical protein PUN28_002388 [Cardiocondyla obscurior]|uniref:Uncharacterized protein n=1 Tax=Cardiocondyla obscurior TaxID=286306 RepID=A0AAW2GU16_9HYME
MAGDHDPYVSRLLFLVSLAITAQGLVHSFAIKSRFSVWRNVTTRRGRYTGEQDRRRGREKERVRRRKGASERERESAQRSKKRAQHGG